MRTRLLPLYMLALALLVFATLACGAAGVLETNGEPRWACPSPTPKPWGATGPVKEIIHHTRPITEGGDWDETIYYEQWEQEYGQLGGPPFPSPTPYARTGASYTLGQRVEVGPMHVVVSAASGPVVSGRPGIPDGTRQLFFIDLQWHNRATVAIPINYADRVRLRAVKTPSGAVVSDSTWGYSQAAREIAGGAELPTSIPPGDSRVRVPVLAPVGQPETVDIVFVGNPAAFYPEPSATPDPSITVVPGTPTATLTPTPSGNIDLQNLSPQLITVQWTAATWVPPGGQPCGDAGVLTDWGNDRAGTWGQPIVVGGPPPPPGADRLVQVALAQVGKRYVWGSKGPDTFDCSGLATWCYAQIGISIPQGTAGQWPGMKPVDASQLRPGDLVFFAIEGGRIDHVGLLADVNADGTWDLIHAASPPLGVRVDYNVFTSAYYRSRIRGFRTAR
jgi:cell wall-associated NlpC family hydrolase